MNTIRQSYTDPREILVIAGAFDLDRSAVQQESPLGVETKRAHPKSRSDLIDRLAVYEESAAEPIEVRLFARPQLRLRQRDGLLRFKPAFCRDGLMVQKMLDAVYLSAAKGGAVAIR